MSLNIMEVVKENGVKDLPIAVKRWFAKALIAESQGDNVAAGEALNKAIAEEVKRQE